jgi:hypothetical protein
MSMLDYPLLSGKLLKDANKQDLTEEARTDTAMEAIVDEIAIAGIEDFALTQTEKAKRLAVYLARCVELAPARKLAKATDS